VSLKDIATFINVIDPPFARLSPAEIDFEARRLFHANVKEIEFLRKASICAGFTLFLAEHSPKAADSVPALRQHLRESLTLPQRFDMAVTLWCLTGEDQHVRFIVDHADGVTTTPSEHPAEYKAVAEWAVQSISDQNAMWTAAVARVRAARSERN
jgi:hypothetical protein